MAILRRLKRLDLWKRKKKLILSVFVVNIGCLDIITFLTF